MTRPILFGKPKHMTVMSGNNLHLNIKGSTIETSSYNDKTMFARDRTLEPIAGHPGMFKVKSKGQYLINDERSPKKREYVIRVKR
jgi:hypothetical protein